MFKKLQVAAISSVILMLSACSNGSNSPDADQSASGDKISITFGNLIEAAPLFHTLRTKADDLLKSQPDVSVKWYDNNNDPQTMISNARLMVQDAPDVIVDYPPVENSAGLAQIFADSGIPCVSVDFSTPGCTNLRLDLAGYASEVAKVIGKMAMDKGWNADNTTVLIGQNAAAGQSGNLAVQTFYSTLAPIMGYKELTPGQITPSMTSLDKNAIQFDGQSTLEPSFAAVQKLVAGLPEENNIILYTLNDDSTLGALRALEGSGRGDKDRVLTAGVGASKQALASLRDDPRWAAEVCVFIGDWGAYAIAAAQQLKAGVNPPEATTELPSVVVTRDNVDEWFPGGATEPQQLPALVESNAWLGDAPVMDALTFASN